MSTKLSTDRVIKFRNELKREGNEDKLLKYREKAKISDKKKYLRILEDEEKLKRKRELNAIAAKKYRERKVEKGILSSTSLETVSEEPFKSASSKSKAISRVEKALPRGQVKKQIVLRELGERHNIHPEKPPNVPQKRARKAYIGVPELIRQFYLSDVVSRLMPGTLDCIKIKNPDGTTQEIQKHIMITSIRNAWVEYNKTFPEQKCSLVYFQKLRPKNVMKKSDSKYFSCMCIHCENFQLLSQSFSPYFLNDKSYSPSDLINTLCCDRNHFDCCSNDCDKCKNYMIGFKQLLKPCCEEEPVRLEKWDKNTENLYTEKFTYHKKVCDVLIEFESSFKYFKLHKFIQQTQKNFLNDSRENLKEYEAVLIVDYAEKYSTYFQRSVQSAYFGSRSISILTARAYVGQLAEYSFAIASDNLKQGKLEVFASLKHIITQLKTRHQNLTHIKLFSDGCGGQFKNKYQFKNLLHTTEDFGVEIELVFFPTGHGKSPCDGIGATVKRHVRYAVLAEGIRVITASEFVACAKVFANKIYVYEMTQDEINQHTENLNVRWEEKRTKGIPGTMKYHSFKCTEDPLIIQASITSLGHQAKNFTLA